MDLQIGVNLRGFKLLFVCLYSWMFSRSGKDSNISSFPSLTIVISFFEEKKTCVLSLLIVSTCSDLMDIVIPSFIV